MAEIKNPKVRKAIFVVLIILGLIPAGFLIWNHYELQRAQEDEIRANQRASDSFNKLKSTIESTPTANAHKLGEKIDLGDRVITIFKLEPYGEPLMKRNYGTAKGQAMEVLIENTGTRSFRLSPLHFTVQDQEGRPLEFYDLLPGGKKPNLSFTGDVAPGQKARGYITFVGETKPVVIYYKSSEGQTAKIVME